MIILLIIYILSWMCCAFALFLLEFPTDENYVEVLRGNKQILSAILFITSWIPIVNTIVAIWLIAQIEIDI